MHEWAFVVAGFAVGLIVSLTGLGGGSLMGHALIFFFGAKPPVAIGTDLLCAASTRMGSTVDLPCGGRIAGALLSPGALQAQGHASPGSADWPLLTQWPAGSPQGAWLGSRLVTRTPERLICPALSVLLSWAGFKLILI